MQQYKYRSIEAALDWALSQGATISAHGLGRFNHRGEVESLDPPEHLKYVLDAAIERHVARN